MENNICLQHISKINEWSDWWPFDGEQLAEQLHLRLRNSHAAIYRWQIIDSLVLL